MNIEHRTPSITEAPHRVPDRVAETLVAASGEQVSKEIVPFDYGRFAYNALHGTNLEAHKANLTAEQAQQINDNFDIELYFGAHGVEMPEDADLLMRLNNASTQREYDEAAKVVEGLQPGDALFVEGFGFAEPKAPPVSFIQNNKREKPVTYGGTISDVISKINRNSGLGITGATKQGSTSLARQHFRKKLEADRRAQKISAADYAYELARLKGIDVFSADMDAFETTALQTAQGKSLLELRIGTQQERQMADTVNVKRDTQSRNIVKDYALDHLPKNIYTQRDDQKRKSKIRVLNGKNHQDRSVKAYEEMGIKVSVVEMASSSELERLTEMQQFLGNTTLSPDAYSRKGFSPRSSTKGLTSRREAFRRSRNEDGRKG